jgi:outer membrane receptor protein involved in Fe transport
VRTPLHAAAALAFALVGFAGPASAATSPDVVAQAGATQGTLNGRVMDQRGSPLAGAAVTVEGNGHAYSAVTKGDGTFSVALPPGVYTVTINHGGYQTAQNDVAIVAGSAIAIAVSMVDANLSSLRVIGRTSTNSQRSQFNVSESSVSTLPPLTITLRQNNNLTDTVGEMPGVIVQRTFSATPNTNFTVRGAGLQTRVTIDGHPVSSGISGQWNTNYASAGIFNDVEVVKGTGLNGALAGESAVGTVNLRTRDFTTKNSAGAQWGGDSFAGGLYNIFADVNFLKNNRASLIVAKSFIGYNGPWNNTFQDRAGNTNTSTLQTGTNQPPSLIGLDQWQGDFSNRYSLQAELVKLRYRFSGSTSVTLEYLGLQGQYQPQGGSYAAYLGPMTLQACQNGAAFQASLSTCNSQSTYTAPYTFNNIGATVNAYTWFPNSFIQNNEPQFAAEFRTTLKNDTLLFRPYTHLINRYISGVAENHYPGNGGAWFAVTSAANCQPLFIAPGAVATGAPVTGAKGPCFPVTTGPNQAAYVGAPGGYAFQFKTTPTAPVCSPTPPFTCYTTRSSLQNDGTLGFGTPFSQPELDRLHGYTFSYIHPVAANIYNFSVDYRKDFSQSQSSDTTAAAPGCSFVIGSVFGANVFVKNQVPGGPAPGSSYQPGCSTAQFASNAPSGLLSYNQLPRSSIGTPPTVSQYTDLALTGTFQLNDKLRLAIGNYVELYKLNAQVEDPAVLAYYFSLGNSSAAPVALVQRNQTYTHYDPHIGLEYRVNRDLSLRLNGGSSITQPYPALVSGFGSITIPNAAQPNYINSIPNPALKPETTVAYDIGFDQRLRDGGVLAMDLYDITVHDVFLLNNTNLGSIGGVCGPQPAGSPPIAFANSLCLQQNQINGPIQRSYGLELSLSKNPINGWGYYLSTTLSRTYLDQLPLSLYSSNISPTNANFNVSGAQLFGYPYLKAYGQLLYNDLRGNTFSVGADFQGANNFTFGPPVTVWDAAARIPIGQKRLRLQISAQNLFNVNTGTALGRSLSNQGNIEPTVYLDPVTNTLKPGDSSVYNRTGTTNINAITPRTIRMSLDFQL